MPAALAERIRALLAPGSPFAARFAARAAHGRDADGLSSLTDYEDRPGQRDFAAEVAATFERGGVLVAEAPTGIGKSLAYLLPAVLLAAERRKKIVIATCSRSLQDQLFERDLPAVLGALGLDVPCVRLKGKQNYLCPHALELEEAEAAEERECLDALRAWAARDAEGDLDRFPAPDAEAFRRVRPRVAADPEACAAATCRRRGECPWVRARRLAHDGRLLVVNHALLAASGAVDGLLPEFDALVVDEAHRLEGVLLQQLARTVSMNRFEELLRRIGAGRAGKRGGGGLAARVRRFALPLFGARDPDRAERSAAALEALVDRVEPARAAAAALFAQVDPRSAGAAARATAYAARARYRSGAELVGPHLDLVEDVLGHCTAFARALSRIAEDVAEADAGGGGAGADLVAELEQTSARWIALASDVQELADPGRKDWVYWRTGGRAVELHGAPVVAGPHARRLVFDRGPATVLTSATLSAGGDVGFFAERLGLGDEQGVPFASVIHPTPFALERQMRAYVFDGGGDEAAAVAHVVAALHRATRRNLLALFTAHERLRRARTQLLARLPGESTMLAQEWDGSASQVSDRFRASRGAILLGVQSLWEGVDFPGGALEILVVAKLPFSVPDEPWVEARAERLVERGRDPFRDDAVPEAVLRFRQGVGRLIRRASDRGVLVVCDPRLAGASYRRPFLDALAVAPRLVRDPEALAADAARFLDLETAAIPEVT